MDVLMSDELDRIGQAIVLRAYSAAAIAMLAAVAYIVCDAVVTLLRYWWRR